MIALSLGEVAQLANARLVPAEAATLMVTGSVETDSRLVGSGALYFTFKKKDWL